MFKSLPMLFVLVFFIPFCIVTTSLGGKGSLCFSYICWFILYVLVLVLFLFLLVSGVGCGL